MILTTLLALAAPTYTMILTPSSGEKGRNPIIVAGLPSQAAAKDLADKLRRQHVDMSCRLHEDGQVYIGCPIYGEPTIVETQP